MLCLPDHHRNIPIWPAPTMAWEHIQQAEATVELGSYQQEAILQALRGGWQAYAVHVRIAEQAHMKQIRALLLKERGEIIASFPTVEQIERGDSFNGNVAYIILTMESIPWIEDCMKAAHQENQIVITITDDGRGIDPLKVKKSAIPKQRLFVVMVGIAEKRVCLVVDQLVGNQEVVIKSLGFYIGNAPYMAGSTILGNGNVALILDAAAYCPRGGLQGLGSGGRK